MKKERIFKLINEAVHKLEPNARRIGMPDVKVFENALSDLSSVLKHQNVPYMIIGEFPFKIPVSQRN